MIQEENSIQCMPFSLQTSKMQSEANTMEKCNFLKSMIHFKIIKLNLKSLLQVEQHCYTLAYQLQKLEF